MSALSPGGDLAATIEAFRIANAPTPSLKGRAERAPVADAPTSTSPGQGVPASPSQGAGIRPLPPITPPPLTLQPDVVVDIGAPPVPPAPEAAYLRAAAELLAAPQARVIPAVPTPPSLPASLAPIAPGVPSSPIAAPQTPAIPGSPSPAPVPPALVGLPPAVPITAPVAAELDLPPPIPAAVLELARAALDAAYLCAAKDDRLAAALLAKTPSPELFAPLDRRALFAIVVDPEALFSPDEKRLARAALRQAAAAMLAPLKALPQGFAADSPLRAYLGHLDGAGAEEKSTPLWLVQRAAVDRALASAGAPLAALASDDASPLLRLVRATFDAPSGAVPRTAELSALAVALKDAPLLGPPFLTAEMLLAGLLALRRASETGARQIPRRRAAPGAQLPDGEGVFLVLPIGQDWRGSRQAAAHIREWEARAGATLPAAYRRFLETFDGGRLYPNMFAYAVPLSGFSTSGAMTFLDQLHSWDHVERASRGEIFGDRVPPDMLAIGADPGGMEIMLSLRPEDFGAVFCWLHSDARWGAPANARIYPLAPSFEAFLAGLSDTEEGAGHRYWSRPALRHLVRRFDLDV